MEFCRSLDKFIRLFYILGLSCYPSFGEFTIKRAKNQRFINYIPLGILAAFTSIASITIIWDVVQIRGANAIGLTMGSTQFAFALIDAVLPTITVIVFAIQAIFLSPHLGKICSLVSIVEHASTRRIDFKADAFKRLFIQKVSLIAFAFMLPLSSMCYSFGSWRIAHFGVMGLKALVVLILIQALFYILLLDHMLKCLIRHIEKQAMAIVEPTTINNSETNQLRNHLMHFREVHYHLWAISQRINKIFGLIIVIIVLQYFIWTTYNMFVAFRLIFHSVTPRSKLTDSHRSRILFACIKWHIFCS